MNKVGSEVTLTLESSPSNADGDPAWTTSRLYSSFKPFLSVLRVCGFYFENNNHLPQTERKYRNTVSKIYGFVVILILVFELLRAISVFQYANAFGPELLLILYNVSWLSNNACKCFPQFFSRHEEILREYAVNYPSKIIAQKVWIATGTCITLLLINAVLFTYVLFYTNVFDLIHMTFENLGAGSWVRIIMMCPYVYHSILWIFPPALFLLFCEMLKSIFNDYSIGLKKTLSMDLIDPILFERKRKEFSDLCRLVNDADEVFCCFCGTTIFLYVVNLCVNLYLILWFEEIRSSQVGTAAVAMWFGTGVLVLTIIAVGAAGVNCQASIYHLPRTKTLHPGPYLKRAHGAGAWGWRLGPPTNRGPPPILFSFFGDF